ncbi:MAG: 2-oxoacid:acceptor oxidoreductase family protein [Deltaproteobacteria bacterium]|nr:2-oxoacid:acceptor oxidoreductase family protein [Deltaproteobacteria bacterium]
MAQRYEIRLAGSGGQGLILAGVILAEAAGIYDGKFVCQTQSYGPAARGGASKAEVVISNREIDYPKAIRPDVLLALNQMSLDKYLGDLKPGGVLLVDADLVREVPVEGAVTIPFTHIARELGKEMITNIVALGALAAITRAVSADGLQKAVLARVPPQTRELNQKALEAGMAAAQKFLAAKEARASENEGLGEE